MKLNIKYAILVGIFWNLSICFGGQGFIINNELGKPFINYYSPKVYKSNARNWRMVQDPRGIMYFANETGILEFDGYFWRKIRVPLDKMVRSIAIDDKGKIFVCADIDMGYLEPDSKGELQYVSLLPFLEKRYRNSGEVSDVITIGNYVYFKTRDKIFKWDGNTFTVLDSVFSFHLYKIKDKIYTRNEGTGLMVLKDDELQPIPDGDFFSSTTISGMLPFGTSKTDNDSILITTSEHGLFVYDYKKFSPFQTDIDRYLIENQINNATVTSDGNYAFATQRGGIVIIDAHGKLLKIIDEKSGLQTNVCYDVFRDQSGGLWLTTEYGINHIREPSPLSSFQNSGELKNISNSVYRFHNRIYAATELGPMILENNNAGFQLIKGSDQPSSVFSEFDDQLLVGTSFGTYVIKNNAVGKQIIDEITTSILVSAYFPNRIYIGTYYGLTVLEKRGDHFKTVYEKKLPDEVIKIIEEQDGSLWINGFFPGLIHVSGNLNNLTDGSDNNVAFKHLNNSTNLPGRVSAIAKINETCLFITDKGVYTYDKSGQAFIEFSALGTAFPDKTEKIVLMANGKNKSIWILAYFQDKPIMGRATLKADGNYKWEPIPALSLIDLATIISIYSDNDPLTGREKLWISSEDGLVLYDPSIESGDMGNFSAAIRKVKIRQDSIIYYGANNFEISNPIEIEYSNNDIIFEYSATHYDKPNSTFFMTSLEGYESNWSDWSLETKKEYTNLSQGDYVFRIKAKNLYGIESDLASYSFTVLAPWYFTWWAYVLYVLFIVGTLFSIRKFELERRDKNNRIRVSELKTEAAEFQAKAAETQAKLIQADNERKTKELEEARELQLSMLPKELPQLPNLDIAVFMQTATEVGGDYYDFSTRVDGSLNIAIGDATGHGMKAGVMVSSMKSIFSTNAPQMDIEDFFVTANSGIKSMQLKHLMMSFTMLNINQNKFQLINAGMPPVFLFRKISGTVEEITEHHMPIGAMNLTKYKAKNGLLGKGDVLLLLSDGMPELQHETGEMYGYQRIRDGFRSVVKKTPQEIVSYLKDEGSGWMQGKEPDDDVTFVVIKVK